MLLLCWHGSFLVKGEQPKLNQYITKWMQGKWCDYIALNSSKTINGTIIMQGTGCD
jgi:hypothetical protein